MTTNSLPTPWWQSAAWAQKALQRSAQFWFATVLLGQAMFSYYIVMLYYVATFNQDLERFNTVMPGGHIEGDVGGNIAVVVHVMLAASITVGGLLQLLPQIRHRWPAIHRWNGRLYVTTALLMSLSGMYMILTRSEKVVGGLTGHIAITINACIILVCAIMALRLARQQRFAQHRVWALRLFLAVSGVWLFRVGLMAWLTWHGQPVGFDPVSFTGPFLTALYGLVYLLPLLLLEVYLRAQRSPSVAKRWLTAGLVIVISLILAFGVFGATLGMWLPRI
ncbi:DUF2306 domain-containing protein [Marinicella meishanensis]|uniref:DUF2306 domain-containing protein n=1 Tax=Marinicella meishanensis TaxID=2873263 RepID=UPI001CBFF7CD|nr:DUF2306 domain-containing protein [Marinicella sp. NBU2979]